MAEKKHGEPRRQSLRRQIGDMKRELARSLSKALEDEPEARAKLIELGLVDPAVLAGVPDEVELKAVIRQFATGLGELARNEPSVLNRLEIRPLDVMVGDDAAEEEPEDFTRVTRAVVFSDLEGFTSFNEDRGDLEAGALLRDHYQAVDAVVRGRGGAVVKTLGDGHMLSFSEPAAAVLASAELLMVAPTPLKLRAGGHVGQVVKADNDLLGHVVNVAARVTDLAAGGVALVTSELRDAAGRLPGLAFGSERSDRVAGLDDPIAYCAVAPA